MTQVRKLMPYPIPAEDPFTALFYGPVGGGKSTMVLRIGNSWDAPVVYLPLDENDSVVRARLRWLEITRKDIHVARDGDAGSVMRLIRERGAGLAIVDPMGARSLALYEAVCVSRQMNVSVIVTATADRVGDDRLEPVHRRMLDLIVRVGGGGWRVEKSHLQDEHREGPVLA